MNLKKIILSVFLIGIACASYAVYAAEPSQGMRLSANDVQKMRLISEAYLKMQTCYYKAIPLERFEKFFYRNQIIAANLIKNEANTFDEKLDALVYSSLVWMVQELRDPSDTLSKFIHKDYLQRVVRENMRSKIEGIGLEIEERDSGIYIYKVYDGSSASEEGVLVNDRLMMINQVDISGKGFKEVEKMLAIPAGEKIQLALIHEGGTETYEVTLTSRIIAIPSVVSRYYKKERAAYIRISEFRDNTAQEVQEQLTRLLKKRCNGLILDLRDNDGGDMEQAVALCDLFLPAGTLVCFFTKRDVGRQDQKTSFDQSDFNDFKQVLILVNEKTGSSAEIVTGALRQHCRYQVIGQKTKGVGALKNTVPLSDGSALYLITSRTYLPDETTFDQQGIMPDIVTDGDTDSLAKSLMMIAEKG